MKFPKLFGRKKKGGVFITTDKHQAIAHFDARKMIYCVGCNTPPNIQTQGGKGKTTIHCPRCERKVTENHRPTAIVTWNQRQMIRI